MNKVLNRIATLTMGLTCVIGFAANDAVASSLFGDSDGDGIMDIYELYGYSSGGEYIDFPGMGANPYRKDIFVEVDVMNGVTVPANAFQDVIDAFANSPVLNVNNTMGIALHIDASGSVPYRDELDLGDPTGHRRYPAIDVNANGEIAVCWEEDVDKNGYYEIYGRRFSSAGVAYFNEVKINAVSDGQQRYPDIGQDGSGRFVVVWQDDRDGNGYYEIYGRLFNASGSNLTADVKVNSESDGQQLLPSVDMDDSGRWTVTWQDDRDGNGYYELYARTFDVSGNPLTGEVKVNPVSSGQQTYAKIAKAPDGRCVVCWQDDRDDNGYYEIYARRLDANGNTSGSEIHVNSTSDGQQLHPAVDINGSGEFVIGWEDDRDGNDYYEIYARKYSSSGSPQTGEVKVNQEGSGQQRRPTVGISGSGQIAVAWHDDRDKNGFYQIYVRGFTSAGSAVTGDILVNSVSTDQQLYPAVGYGDNDHFAVAYQDDRDETDYYQVYFRIFASSGTAVSGDILANNMTESYWTFKNKYYTDVRGDFYHYCIVANSRFNTGSSGVSTGRRDFIVSLGLNPVRRMFAGTFMHELGHNLSLKHGGFENTNYKPNYMSVMRYGYQFWGADNNCNTVSSSSDVGDLNYSLGRKFDLSETSLDERVGICNGELDVNWCSNGQQIDVDVDANDNGSFVVAYEDDRDGNGYHEIWARSYDASGQPLMNEVHVNRESSGQQYDPAVGMASDGSFVVTWEDDKDGNGYYQIYAQRHTASGSRTGGTIVVNQESDGQQINPDISVADDGTFVVVWQDDRDGNGYYEIYGRLFNSSGSPLTGDLKINQESSGQQYLPRVDIADDHRFVVVWQDDRDKNGYYEIYARRFNSSGSARGGGIHVNEESSGQQLKPDVGIAADGRFVVVWEDDKDKNGYYQIYGRRFGDNGSASGNSFTVNQAADGQQLRPRVAANDNFEFAVCWHDDRDENGYYEIVARSFNSAGSVRSNDITVNPVSDGQQYLPDVGIDAAGQYYVVWQDDRDGNGYYEIFACRSGATGAKRDRVAFDWDGDGNSAETGVSADINGDGKKSTLKDHNDWKNLELK